MKAWTVKEYGPKATFALVEQERPVPGPGEVLIEVRATSLNPVDNKILRGELPPVSPALPSTLHGDVAGVVSAMGPGVKGLAVGDEVFGVAGGVAGSAGASADYMIADARLLAPKPKSLDFASAAALPLVAITAYEGLVDKAKVQDGQSLLVYGGVGGVGHVVVQMARILGARVTATVSDEAQAKVVRALGASDVVDYRRESREQTLARLTNGRGFDAVFDTIGGTNIDVAIGMAANYGHIVSLTAHGELHDLVPLHLKSASLHIILMLLPLLTGEGRERHGAILRQVATWADQGQLRPLLDERRFKMSELDAAHAYFEQRRHTGKIVIVND